MSSCVFIVDTLKTHTIYISCFYKKTQIKERDKMRYKFNIYDTACLFCLTLVAFGVAMLMPDLLFATPPANPPANPPGNGPAAADPISEVLCNVLGFLTGSVGTAIGTAAVIVVGVGFLLGKTSWGIVLATVSGLAVIFGAPAIVNLIAGTGGATARTCVNSAGTTI